MSGVRLLLPPVLQVRVPVVEAPVDEEAEKRKARAARVGIPLVEPKTAAPTPKGKKGAANGKVVKAAVVEVRVCALRGRWSVSAKTFLCVYQDSAKVAARAARFLALDR